MEDMRFCPGLLLFFSMRTICCKIFKQIGNGIPLALEFAGIKRNPACSLRPDANGMINIVRAKSGFFDFFHGEIPCKLMDNGRYHLQVRQFFCTRRSIGNVL